MFEKLLWPAAVPAPGIIFSSIVAAPPAYPMAEQQGRACN